MSFFTYSSYWPFGKHVAWVFMIAISCTKAMLVIMFFMHLLWEANWKWVLTIPASFMSIFLMLMLVPDIGMRQNNGYERRSIRRSSKRPRRKCPSRMRAGTRNIGGWYALAALAA
jgi:hypothetical protein